MTYRAALIGCGNIGSQYADDPLIKGVYTHAGAYAACPDTELVAVCDLDNVKAKACADKWNVPAVYTDISTMLQEQRPQIVSVCTPDKTHAMVIEQVLKSEGVLGVLAEKPLALDAEQANHLVNLAQERNIQLAINYSRRYSKGHQQIKSFIQAGNLGSIQSVSGFYTKGIFHNGTHWLDLARWLVGELVSVQGFFPREKSDSDPMLNASLTFANGATGFLQALDAEAFSLFEMDIIGTNGRIRIVDSGHKVEYFSPAPSPYYTGYQTVLKTQELDGELDNTLLNAVRDLVACVKNGNPPLCNGHDGLAALQLAANLVRSADANERIEI